MLRQGTLQQPFTSSPPTGMLKYVFPYLVRPLVSCMFEMCDIYTQKASNDLHADFTATLSEGKCLVDCMRE